MSRLRGIGTLGCVIALASSGCAGHQHRAARTVGLPWDVPADEHVHGPNDPFTPQPQPAFGLARYFPRLAEVARVREQAASEPRDRFPLARPRRPARLDGPEPIRSSKEDEGLEDSLDLQARAESDVLPVMMVAPVSPRSVADAELDVNADGVLDRKRPPFRAKDDRAARLVQARDGDLRDPLDPFGNLDGFEPPSAVAWPEPPSETTPLEAGPRPQDAPVGGWGLPSESGVVATAPPPTENRRRMPVMQQVPLTRTAGFEGTSSPSVDETDPFADLRLPPIPPDLSRTGNSREGEAPAEPGFPTHEARRESRAPSSGTDAPEADRPGSGPPPVASSPGPAPRETTLALPGMELEAGAEPLTSAVNSAERTDIGGMELEAGAEALTGPQAPPDPQSQPAETFTQDVGSASDPFAGLKIPPPPADSDLFEPVPSGRPRLDPSQIGGGSMYALSVRRVAPGVSTDAMSGLSGRPRIPQRPDEMALPPATFPPTYYQNAAGPSEPAPPERPPVQPPRPEPAPRKRWQWVPRLFGRFRDHDAHAGFHNDAHPGAMSPRS